jgi:hypothetical protein
MSNQVARLFLRGKLMNKTAKNLTTEQVKEVEKHCQVVWEDPALARTKTTFCSKLAWTIGNEYQDLEAAMQEVWIVYWKTTVDILFHKPKQEMKSLIEATCAKCSHIKTIKCHPCDGTGLYSTGQCESCRGRGYTKTAPEMLCGCGSSATLDFTEDLFAVSLSEAHEIYKRITGREAPARDMSILENPIQRHKFYKTTLWTYLRQIVNENKPHVHKAATTIKDYAEKVALALVREIVADSCKTFKTNAKKVDGKLMIRNGKASTAAFDAVVSHTTTPDNIAIITAKMDMINLDGVRRLRELQDMMRSHNVAVSLSDHSISIQKTGDTTVIVANVHRASSVNFLSLSQPDEDAHSGNTYLYPNAFVESIAPPASISEMETQDGLNAVRKRLSPIAQQVFDLILSPPDEYANQYSTNPVRRSNVSKYLNLSKSEVDAAWEKIQRATIAAGLKDE